MRKQYLGVSELWQMADNITLSSSTERRARARAVTRASFKFLSTLTVYDEEEELKGDDGKVAVPGEGLVSVSASRQRLRLLERHETANCVEYRMFAAALANDDAVDRGELCDAERAVRAEARHRHHDDRLRGSALRLDARAHVGLPLAAAIGLLGLFAAELRATPLALVVQCGG